MREIRTFELDRCDAPTGWFIDRPQTLRVTRGQIWLTIEGETGDFWLDEGASVELKPYTSIWVSGAKDGSRFSLASASASTSTHTRSLGEIVRAWFARRTPSPHIAVSKA